MLSSVLEVSRHLIQAITALVRTTGKSREVKYTYRREELRVLVKRTILIIQFRTRIIKIKKWFEKRVEANTASVEGVHSTSRA